MLERYEKWGWNNFARAETARSGILQPRRPQKSQTCHYIGDMLHDETVFKLSHQPTKARPFDILKIGLRREREELYERINRRVDQEVTDGLVEEARRKSWPMAYQRPQYRRI